MLTKEQLVEGLQKQNKETAVSSIMNGEVESFNINDDLSDAFIKFQRDKKRQRLYPVMENGSMAGVIDMENLQEFLVTRSHHTSYA